MTVRIETDIEVPTRDGIVLATDVLRPDDRERHPVLVTRTPYGKANRDVLLDRSAAVEHGYAVVVQDTRGRYGSGGSFVPFFAHESDDGYDTIEWAAAQPWSDGNVGVYGASAMAATAVQAAVAAPPHLRAAMAYAKSPNPQKGWIYTDGVLELGYTMHWNLFSLRIDQTIAGSDLPSQEKAALLAALRAAQERNWDTIRHLPLDSIPAFDARVAPQWHEWLSHPRYDDHWKRIDAVRAAPRVRVPILHGTGWYDIFLRGHLDLHAALLGSGDDDLRWRHRLFIGPWDHMSYLSATTSAAGDRDFGPEARSGPEVFPALIRAWFDHWLRGADLPDLLAHPVRYFVMGTNEWRTANAWPPPHENVRYFLHGGGRANTLRGDGTIDRMAPSGDEPPDTYTYDPRDPVPSVGGRTLHREWGPAGVFDQATVEARPDVLVYTTAELSAPLEIAGPVTVTLHASTDAEDSDLTGKLVDVEPGGYCAILAEGIVRARYRNGAEREEWIDPNGFACRVDLWDVAHVFRAGHRVRLEVSSSNFPRFDRNLNTKVSPEHGTEADVRTAVHHVWHDARRASFLELPVALR